MSIIHEIPPEQIPQYAELTYHAYLAGEPGIVFEDALNAMFLAVQQDPNAGQKLHVWQMLGRDAVLQQDGYGYDEHDPGRLRAEIEYGIAPLHTDKPDFFIEARQLRGDLVYEPGRHMVVFNRPMVMYVDDTEPARHLLYDLYHGEQIHATELIGMCALFEPPEDQPNLP